MLMADDGPNDCQMEAFAWEDLDNENLCMDLDQLFHMLDESPESAQSSPEEHPVNGVMQGSPNLAGSVLATCDVSTSTAVSPSLNFETSAMTGVSHASYVGATNGFCGSDGMTDGFCDRAALSNNICVSFGNSNGVKLETLLKSDSPVPGFCGRLGEWMSVEDPCHFNVGTENISCHDSYTGGALDCKGTGTGTGTVRRHFNDMFSLATSIFDGSTAKTDASSFDCTNVKTESHINFIGRDVFTEGVTDFTGVFAMEPNFTLPNDSTSMHSSFFPPSGQFPDSTLAFRVPYGSDSKRANLSNDEMKVFNEDSRIGSGVPLVCGADSYRSDHRLSKFVQSQDVFAEEQKFAVHESKRPHVGPQNYVGSPYGMSFLASECLQNEQKVESSFLLPSNISKEQVRNIGLERCLKTNKIPNSVRDDVSSRFSKISRQKAEKNPSAHTLYCNDDDDADICILENISAPAPHPTVSLTNSKSLVTSQRTLICDSFDSPIVGPMSMVPKAKDERSIFKAALQDLCQPRSEDALPDGVLAVPLLRHQRIALSWMVKKEKDVSRCSGGILADDQGLGKTISTIALILKEKAPITVESITSIEPETFNLDEDDCTASNSEKLGEDAVDGKDNGIIQRCKSPFQAKRKPAAGTLVVCPTSVLRQWSDELQNKVTPEAGLSVLVYHGANRTKDPFELSKFDVVLTTYSIVSMEVPKQPMVDEDDDDTKGVSDSPTKFSCSKKRKYPPTGSKKSLRGQKALEETLSRPLASVRWFRVVLDEAQSIKNHRTQVARACWGLRAKRRWCLSGTPIQNAVDDLYSYFRFLRYDPYSKYQSFCSALKGPIHRSPASGYKKLQAVLKTIMLRRTKGTFLDGEPIICLPPKIIELKQVDFTEEERDFYNRLEADSRAQFAEYEAAGTVKQNYVNILLMLLRLRQACDHPLLVRSSCSNSMDRSSLEVAKKLSQEKQINLMKCLEDSLAICGICSDPPEEAVVTSCGHVFCNQCVCDLVTGEDTHCPTSKCQATLRTSHIFSSATLTSCLSDQSCAENTSDSSPSKPSNKPDLPCSSRGTYASSKIKAALQVLQALIKQPNYSVNPQSIESHSHDDYKQGCEINETNKVSAELASSKVGEKALIFSQWTRMLDLLEACLKKSSIQYRRLDGTMSVAARDKAVKDFNSLPEVTVLIMSLKAASLGLNLVAASHVMLLDLWWNPTTEDQAIDRAHRIGQTRPVTVLRLTVKNTVEDRILALQQKKRKMVASAFGEDEKGCSRTRLTEEDLQYLFADR